MKAPTRYGLMSLIVMLSSLPLGAAGSEQPAADAAANRAKNFILKDRRDGGGRRTAPSPCVDPYRLWRMNHI